MSNRSGMLRCGVHSPLPPLAALTRGHRWPTPKAQVSGPDYARINRKRSGGDDLFTAVARIEPGPVTPDWVEWLMGYPPGWTSGV